MDVAVFGANGPTGRLLTAQALAEGHRVTAFTRNPGSFPLRHADLRIVGGDVLDAAAVDGAVAGRDVVLSTLGAPYSRKPITVYSEGTANIIAAMDRHGLTRLVCVSSTALDLHPQQEGGVLFRRVLEPFIIHVVGRTLYADLRRMERLVADSGLAWTIVRSGGLFESAGTTRYEVAERAIPQRFTSRADLADCLLREAHDDAHVGTTVAIATPSAPRTVAGLLWREAFGRGAPAQLSGAPAARRAG